MATTHLDTVVHRIRDLAGRREGGEQTDGALLRGFLSGDDPSAFKALMLRHGPMVLRVCQRTLHHTQDAEDALQATFLVLARQAASIRKKESLASWLHGVAYRMATHAKRAAARRHKHESQAGTSPPRGPALHAAWQELQVLLDEEIENLPQALRAAFVTCCLENKSCAEAARQLGVPESAVSKRLSRARKRLRERLTQRGVSLTAVLAAATVGANGALASLPRSLVSPTVKAVTQITAGQALRGGPVSTNVITLLEGLDRAMFLTSCKSGLLLLLGTAILGASLGMAALHRATAGSPPLAPRAASEEAKGERQPLAGSSANAGAKESVPVRGRVLDPSGQPLAGAKLYLDTYKPQVIHYPLRATTGADGRFDFTFARSELDRTWSDTPTGHVVATADGFGFDVAAIGSGKGGELTLRLVKDVPVRGRILDAEGKPVPGAKVRVTGVRAYGREDLTEELDNIKKGGMGTRPAKVWSGSLPGQPSLIATDSDGRFHLKGLGRERIVDLTVEGPAIQYARLQAMTRAGGSAVNPNPYRQQRIYGSSFEHLAAPSRTIRGVVRDKQTGKGVPGVRIEANGTLHTTQTDKDGRYELLGHAKSKEYHLTAAPPEGGPYFMATASFPDNAGLAPLDADVQMVRGIPVRGRVTDQETGRPIARAQVQYCAVFPNPNTRDGVGDSHAVTGPDGSFAVVALPGPGLLAVTDSTPNSRYMPALVTVKEMKAFYKNWADPAAGGLPSTEGSILVAAGARAARGLLQDNHHALVLIEPEATAERLSRDVVLRPALTRKGTLTGPDGKPAVGVRVFGLVAHPFADTTLPTADFTVGGINPRRSRHLLFLHKEKGLGAFREIRGDEKGPLVVRLEPLCSASGRVVDKDGQPIGGLVLNLNRSRLIGPGGVQLTTGPDGRFRAEGLVPGQKYDLTEANRRRSGSARGIVVESGKDNELGDINIDAGN